jgi:hypothetical protein
MITRSVFSFLRRETQRTFGEGCYLFLPATRGAGTYTVVLPCTSSVARGRARDLSGVLNMAADTRTIEVDAAGLPFEPRPEDIVLFGNAIRNASGVWIQDPAAPAVKYRITSADKAAYHTHWRLEVERH